MARINYKQLYNEKCEELDRLQEEYDALLYNSKDRERLQNLVSAQNALIWYNKKYDDEILLFEDWLEMLLK